MSKKKKASKIKTPEGRVRDRVYIVINNLLGQYFEEDMLGYIEGEFVDGIMQVIRLPEDAQEPGCEFGSTTCPNCKAEMALITGDDYPVIQSRLTGNKKQAAVQTQAALPTTTPDRDVLKSLKHILEDGRAFKATDEELIDTLSTYIAYRDNQKAKEKSNIYGAYFVIHQWTQESNVSLPREAYDALAGKIAEVIAFERTVDTWEGNQTTPKTTEN